MSHVLAQAHANYRLQSHGAMPIAQKIQKKLAQCRNLTGRFGLTSRNFAHTQSVFNVKFFERNLFFITVKSNKSHLSY